GSAPAPPPTTDLPPVAHAPTPHGPRPTLPAPEPPPAPLGPSSSGQEDHPLAPPQQIAQQFDAEPIDRFWKTNTEAEIRRRVPTANAIECHQTLCRITLAGTETDVAAQSEQHGAERSLQGIVGSIVLTAPAKRADGTLELRAYARFEHPQ